MTEQISLKHNSSTFFKEQLVSFKKNTQETLTLLKKDVNSICLDSPTTYESRQSENVLASSIPHNFYDAAALNEASRGDSYAVFPELVGKDITLFDIKTSLAARGVLDPFLQDRLINLVLQCRGALPFGIAQPVQQLAAEHGIIVSPITKLLNLKFDVQNGVHVKIKIEMPLQTPNMDLAEGSEVLGTPNCELDVRTSSIYLKEMAYTKTSNSPKAEELLQIVSKDYIILSEIWDKIKRCLGIVEQKPEFELSLKSPSI